MKELIEKQLDDLDNARARIDALKLKKKELIDSVIPDNVRDDINGIEDEFDPAIRDAEEIARQLEDDIKGKVALYGSSIEGEHLKATYYKGRVSWDTKLLEGFALSHPEVLGCRKTGDPYTVIKNK